MPTYAWKCVQCGKVWEQKGTYESQDVPCPTKCGGAGKKIPVMPAKTTVGKYGKGGG